MSSPASMMPAAFLGYRSDGRGGLFIRCCAYCPDKDELHAWADAKGSKVTDSICPACAQKHFGLRLGEQPDEQAT